MIHRLIGGEATDRRHNAERIRGQHDNVLRLSTDAAHFHIRNERQGIGCPGVLGQRFVVEVQTRVCGSITTFSSSVPNMPHVA